MAECRILLLGPPRLKEDNRLKPIALRKAIALVAYLVVERRPFSREYLAALLWPDFGRRRALANLRRALSFVRELFGDACLVTEADQIELDTTHFPSDIDEFHRLISAHGPEAGDSLEHELERLEAAAALYRGSFLEGFNLGDCAEYDEWQDSIRQQLFVKFDELLERICTALLDNGSPRRVIPYAHRWLELDYLNEQAHCALMIAYARDGRADLAHIQFEACARGLASAGMQLDSTTVELHKTIVGHRPLPASNPIIKGRGGNATPAGRKIAARGAVIRRRVLMAVLLLLPLLALLNVYSLRYRIFGADVAVTEVAVARKAGRFDTVRVSFSNHGAGIPRVPYSLMFTADGAIGTRTVYRAYAGSFRIGWNGRVSLEIRNHDIQTFLTKAGLGIPPGGYVASVVVDRIPNIGEQSYINNEMWSGDNFYAGSSRDDAVEVDLKYRGPDPFDDHDPIRIYLGDATQPSGPDEWGSFRMTRDGDYYLPLDEIPRKDSDGSGYFMLVVYDSKNNVQAPYFNDPQDYAGLYKDVPDNLVYGPFQLENGTPVFPGEHCSVRISRPPLPAPDAYEDDDVPSRATLLEYADLPVRQYHTFDLRNNGTPDRDWYRIFLRAGQSVSVQTSSPGGRWVADTDIELDDPQLSHVLSGRATSPYDTYRQLSFVNESGVDGTYYFAISPFRRASYCANPVGEYMVEFRPGR